MHRAAADCLVALRHAAPDQVESGGTSSSRACAPMASTRGPAWSAGRRTSTSALSSSIGGHRLKLLKESYAVLSFRLAKRAARWIAPLHAPASPRPDADASARRLSLLLRSCLIGLASPLALLWCTCRARPLSCLFRRTACGEDGVGEHASQAFRAQFGKCHGLALCSRARRHLPVLAIRASSSNSRQATILKVDESRGDAPICHREHHCPH